MAKITKVPNGPLIKKTGKFKGSTLKNGGPVKKETNTVVKDKTSVKINDISKIIKATEKQSAFKPDYRYVDTYEGEGTATKKDSADYKRGFYQQRSNRLQGKGNKAVGVYNPRAGYGAQEYKDRTYTRDKNKTGGVIKKAKAGGMIKRADGSYSKRGLWDNIRANKGSGKKPTKQMLVQEKKIKAKSKK